MTRRFTPLAACALAVLALAGCTIRSEREEHLPWLLKKSTYTAFGNFSGNSQSSWFVKHWGFWRSIDVWNVVVLDPEHVIVWNEEGHGLLERGSLRAVPVCPKLASVSVPPGAPALDCVEGATHAHGDLTGVRWRRFDPSGRVVDERIFTVSGPGRVFAPPARVFAYDDDGLPYFLMMSVGAVRDYRHELTDCALVSERDDDPPLAGPAAMSWDACRQPAAWEAESGRRFHEAGLEPRSPDARG